MIKSTRNQMGNVRNHYQTRAKKVLCVCSAGLLRSPTMANVLHETYGYNTRAAGSCEDFALIPVSEALIAWADEIVFVNSSNFNECLYHNASLEDQVRDKAKVLDIEDDFCWNDPTLKQMIIEQYGGEQ